MNQLSRNLTALAAAAALALGGAAPAQAKHGADDPVGHEAGEHAAGVHHHRHGGRDDAKASSRRGREAGERRHNRRGDNEAPGHKRHGNDDGPNHS